MATNKTVFFLIGILLVVLGVSMLAPYLMQILYSENSHSFVSSSFVTIFIGILFILANLEKEFKLNLRQTFLFSIFWLTSPNKSFLLKVLQILFLRKLLNLKLKRSTRKTFQGLQKKVI